MSCINEALSFFSTSQRYLRWPLLMDRAGQLLPNEDRRRALSIAVPRRPRAARPRRGSPLAALWFPKNLHLPGLPRGMPARREGFFPQPNPLEGTVRGISWGFVPVLVAQISSCCWVVSGDGRRIAFPLHRSGTGGGQRDELATETTIT